MPRLKFNVCIIDDDRIYQFTARKTLEALGTVDKIDVCSNGEEGIEHLKLALNNPDKLPDVIFLDINMPLMDGWQFLDEYVQLAKDRNIAIFMVSSSVDEADIKRAKEYEVVKDYIIKPIGRERFEELLNRVVKM
jgi:CheY-like chemotaxis protein